MRLASITAIPQPRAPHNGGTNLGSAFTAVSTGQLAASGSHARSSGRGVALFARSFVFSSPDRFAEHSTTGVRLVTFGRCNPTHCGSISARTYNPMAKIPTNGPTRQELEELWCLKVKQAQQHYKDASAKWREAIEAQLPSPDGNFAARRAAQAQAVAHREFKRILAVFRDLVVKGKVPSAG